MPITHVESFHPGNHSALDRTICCVLWFAPPLFVCCNSDPQYGYECDSADPFD